MAPSPELGAVLAGLDIHALAGSDLVEVLRARARQLAHEQARLLATMAEIGWCDPAVEPDEVGRLAEPPRADEPLVSAADEIRAAMAWTRNAAYREYHFAQALVGRLPAVFTALDAGAICRSKAWLFTELCAELTDEQARVVCERLLPAAGRLTTGELAARIKKLAIALDPDWAARRYTHAVRDRDVIGYLDEDGTATVTGRRLPADQAAVACARIEELAKAAKRAGHPGRIGPLRADIYLGLLDGRWAHHTREEIITDLLAQATVADETTPADQAAEGENHVGENHRGENHRGENHEGENHEGEDPVGEKPVGSTTGSAGPPDQAPADPPFDGDTPVAARGWDGARPDTPAARVGVELRVGLSTLLGRDHHPGEIPGWGPVTAETARTIAVAQHSGEWRYALTDPDGQLLLAGITHRRPVIGRRRAPVHGGIVELHIPAALLTELAAHPEACGPCAAMIADLAAQYDASRALGARNTRSGIGWQDPAARFAGAVLRRHVQIRDRTCVYPGCRCSARHADLDHTLDHGHGGATTEANSGPLCRHDHRLKHDGGWRLRQPEAGHFVWTSPLGRSYHTRPQPITIDLPDPHPGPGYPDYAPPVTPGEDRPIFYRPPPAAEPPPVPAQVVDPDEPPPF